MKIEINQLKQSNLIAADIASKPELWDSVIQFTPHGELWECMGFSRTMNTALFARLVTLPNMKLRQVNKYVSPDTPVTIIKH